jgi:hypothetical protein
MDLNHQNISQQGQEVLLRASDNNGEDWYIFTCMEKQSNSASRGVKQRSTQCGPVVGKDSTIQRKKSFDGTLDNVEDALVDGVGFASSKKIKQWHKDGTALLVQQIVGDGTEYIDQSPAYISDYKENIPVDDVIDYSVEFTCFGEWVISA